MIVIGRARADDAEDWQLMREALWPDGGDTGTHADDIASLLDNPGETVNLIARDADGAVLGFAEASLRRDYVNGCDTSPVVFLEGIYVVPEARGQGVARALVSKVEAWGLAEGCTEFASDADIENAASHAMHASLGFEETQRVVFFRKALKP